jgi:hypothetical protein
MRNDVQAPTAPNSSTFDLTKNFLNGTRAAWTFEKGWTDRDGIELKGPMIGLGTREAVQKFFRVDGKWQVETIMDQPLPNPDDLNAAIPRDQWEMGMNGPREPWAKYYAAYLLDPKSAELYTFSNQTIGAEIAVGKLKSRMQMKGLLSGGYSVYPIINLTTAPMKTSYGQKTRPEFEIIGWETFGAPSIPAAPVAQIEHQAAPPTTEPTPAPEPVRTTKRGVQKNVRLKPAAAKTTDLPNDPIPDLNA